MNKTLLAVLIAGLGTVTAARADLAPPSGALIDLAAVPGTTVTQAYTQYSATFVAGQTTTFVSFLFRRDPSYFGFDDTAVTLGTSGPNLLADPGFELATVGTDTPTGWGNFEQTGGIPARGDIESGVGRGGVSQRSGLNYWNDGSVGAYDGLYQTITTVVGQTYQLSFWLENPNGSDVYSQTGDGIDVLAYEGAALPDGTVITAPAPPAPPPGGGTVPEPDIAALMGLGAVGLLGARRRKAN